MITKVYATFQILDQGREVSNMNWVKAENQISIWFSHSETNWLGDFQETDMEIIVALCPEAESIEFKGNCGMAVYNSTTKLWEGM